MFPKHCFIRHPTINQDVADGTSLLKKTYHS